MSDHQVIWFEGRPVLLKRKSYSPIKLQVTSDGSLACLANQSAKLSDILSFLSSQKTWIDRQIRKIEHLSRAYPPIYWQENTKVPFLGRFKDLQVFYGSTEQIKVHQDVIEVHLPHPKVPQSKWSRLFAHHYKKIGVSFLENRLKKWSDQMALKPHKVSFRSHNSQWGSCSTSGSVSLNWKLIVAPLPVIDYVVIHELSHLKHLNHSPDFWRLVENHCRHHKICRQWLRRNQFAFDFLEDVPKLHASSYPLF